MKRDTSISKFTVMSNPYTREKIENWVGDFCMSDQLREATTRPELRERASAVLVEFMVAACERPGGSGESIEPDEVEENDLKRGLIERVARLSLPESVRGDVPGLCAAFLSQLEEEGRLGGGRMLGAYVRALKESYLEAASGKKKPVVRPGSKIGRNDPCPCGSGKKYKTCCMRGD
ncbi:MAG: SEC-C domain-containing protein [Phycisphaerales bacterium]|nr:SEC-C domain-containing protein [Phycisphaerales bacterium]MCI0631779.1 SEC-C domain-containing protein [Phycisphaerales bacterium]MCI0677244.1 SEC-C domain-containing protein [Phycisphaerales bacterium]